MSGIHLIELASNQYGMQYRLGFGGKAVCQLEGVGPDGDDCFGGYPFFWGYWHWDGGTGWDWADLGRRLVERRRRRHGRMEAGAPA